MTKLNLRRGDVDRTVNRHITNAIKQKSSSANYNYKMSRSVRPSRNDFSSSASRNRQLSNSYYRKYQDDLASIKKLEGQYRVTNKEPFKSLGRVVTTQQAKRLKK